MAGVNVKAGKNKRNLSGSLLNRIFDDGKEHFIIVRKGGEKIAVSFIYSASDPANDNAEIVVTEYPECRTEWEKAEKDPVYTSYLKNILQTHIDAKIILS